MLTAAFSSEVSDNLTEADGDETAEFRQGGIAQQLMSSYPAMSVGNMYGGNTGGYQYGMAGQTGGSGGGTGSGAGYVNMLRNLYRPPSFGLTDKVRHWVKSFMNRRQYVKPYYNPAVGGISYAPSEYGSKPVFAANGYKAISVPLRQLQKYYKPYYGASEGANAASQFAGASAPGSASASSFYSPNGVASNGGLYASESANAGQFSGGFGSPSEQAALFGNPGGASGSNIFSSGNNPFSSGGASSGIFNSPGGSPSGIFGSSDGSNSGMYGGAGGLYGASGSPSSGLFHGSNPGAAFSLDGSSYGGSDGSSPYFASSNGGGSDGSSPYFGSSNGGGSDGSSPYFGSSNGGGYGNSAAASSILASLNGGGSSGGNYGDLFASGANPAPSLYNPSNSDSSNRGYGGGNPNKKSNYGASNTALYMSSDDRNSESSYPKSSGKENSFNVDSSGNSQAGASYSFSVQPAQSKSYSSAAFENAGFQPVAYSQQESAGNAPSFQEKSS